MSHQVEQSSVNRVEPEKFSNILVVKAVLIGGTDGSAFVCIPARCIPVKTQFFISCMMFHLAPNQEGESSLFL